MTVIIVLGSISTLTYISYDAWSLEEEEEKENLQPFWLNRRNFPTSSELDMFENLTYGYNHVDNDSLTNNVRIGIPNIVTWPSEYQTRTGLLGKFQGFMGVPIPKMVQSPLALNASSLESFYSLLASSNASLIVFPTENITDRDDQSEADGGEMYQPFEVGEKNETARKSTQEFSEVATFALLNFQKAYRDNGFTVLDVPNPIKPPSPDGDIAFMHPSIMGDPLLQSTVFSPEIRDSITNSKVIIPYTNQFFEKISDSDFLEIMQDKKDVTLNTYNKSQTLWSSKIQFRNGAIDYIGSKLKVVDQNETRPHDECGIVWQSGDKKYYVRIRDDKIEFSETPPPEDRFNIENRQVKLDRWHSYELKITFSEDNLNVFVNDILRLRVPSNLYDGDSTISRIGLRCAGNIAEFGPVEIARISNIDNHNDYYPSTRNATEKELAYQYFYPLTSLALSGASYDTFLSNDRSIFSKGNIVLTNKAIGDFVDYKLSSKDQT